MKKKLFIVLMLAMFSIPAANAQQWGIGFNAGRNICDFGSESSFDNLRQGYRYENEWYYEDGSYGVGSISSRYVSITPEYHYSTSLCFVTGLQLTVASSNFTSDKGYFYWMYDKQGSELSYCSIHKFRQTNSYVGVPLAVKYLVRGTGYTTVFFQAGVTPSFRVKTNNDIQVRDLSMNSVKGTISDQLGTAEDFCMPIYGLVGVQFDFGLSAAVQFPYTVIGSTMSSFAKDPGLGFGIQLSYVFLKSFKE